MDFSALTTLQSSETEITRYSYAARSHQDIRKRAFQIAETRTASMLLSPLYLAIGALLLAAVQFVQSLRSPLRRLPGPNISLFTSLVLKWKELKAQRTLYVHALHEKYGPVVRLSPNEVSFTSWPALKEIYCSGGSGYDKSDFYDLFKIYGRR